MRLVLSLVYSLVAGEGSPSTWFGNHKQTFLATLTKIISRFRLICTGIQISMVGNGREGTEEGSEGGRGKGRTEKEGTEIDERDRGRRK